MMQIKLHRTFSYHVIEISNKTSPLTTFVNIFHQDWNSLFTDKIIVHEASKPPSKMLPCHQYLMHCNWMKEGPRPWQDLTGYNGLHNPQLLYPRILKVWAPLVMIIIITVKIGHCFSETKRSTTEIC